MSTQTLAEELTGTERKDLERLEGIVSWGEKATLEVAHALKEINTRRLYRETHKAFTDYLADRWPRIKRSYAYELITAARVDESVRNSGRPGLENVSQARPLAKLDDTARSEVWGQAQEAGQTTTEDLKRLAFAALPPEKQRELIEREEREALEEERSEPKKGRRQEPAREVGGLDERLESDKEVAKALLGKLAKMTGRFSDVADELMADIEHMQQLIDGSLG